MKKKWVNAVMQDHLSVCDQALTKSSFRIKRCMFTLWTGQCSLGGGSPAACAGWQQRRLGDGGSRGSEACWEVASCVQSGLGPQQQPRGLWHAGIPGHGGV